MPVKKLNLIALYFLVLQATFVNAQETLESVMLRMKPESFSKIHYQETRYLELLDKPWSGSGYFYSMPDGMIKEQWYPQREIMAARGDQLYYFDPFADVRYQAGIEGDIGPQAVAFKGLISGDLLLVQKFFQTNFKTDAKTWIITLMASDPDLSEQLEKIVISGLLAKPADKIEMVLSDGDRHVMQLKQEDEGQHLQAKIKQLFEDLQGR